MSLLLPNLKPPTTLSAGVPDRAASAAIRGLEVWAQSLTQRLAGLDVSAGGSIVGGVSSVTGTGVISVSPTTGAVVVSANLSAYPTGSGTTNKVPKWTSPSALGNSNITDTGSLITLGSGSGDAVSISGYAGVGGAPNSNAQVLIDGSSSRDYTLYATSNVSAVTTNHVAGNFALAGTVDATAAVRQSTGVSSTVSTTRSAGSNALTNIAVYANAFGAQNNFGFWNDNGDNYFNVVSGDSWFWGDYIRAGVLTATSTFELSGLNSSLILFSSNGGSGPGAPGSSISFDAATSELSFAAGALPSSTIMVLKATGAEFTGLWELNGTTGSDGDVVTRAGGVPTWAPAGGAANPPQGSYAPGSYTVATGKFAHAAKRQQFTTTQRLTLQGDARLSLSN